MRNKITIDSVSFELRKPHDLGWLKDIGTVFTVFDQQDSGNLCFGIENANEKLFVKYAGAGTVNFDGKPEDAVLRLRQGIFPYGELAHPLLTKLIDSFETVSGYAAVFEWFEGENLHPHWKFAGPAKYSHPDSPYFRFKQLPVSRRLDVLSSVFSFHVHCEEKGFVAIDFYDGSILYNFPTFEMKLCDIDFYTKKPYVNTMGRMWGSSRFMSPEEFQLGATIDGRTNVFNMGAMAFSLAGGEKDRSFEKWEAGRLLYDVVLKAVCEDRDRRYGSVAEFTVAWEDARKVENI